MTPLKVAFTTRARNEASTTQIELESKSKMKFQRIEFSWRAAFLGIYLTPEKDKLWITIIPFLPLYFKKVGGGHAT